MFRNPYTIFKKPIIQFKENSSLTMQHFKDECDVYNILDRYKQTGHITHVQKTQPQYGDFSNVTTYHESMNLILAADAAFNDLPSDIRKKLNNNPENLIKTIEDGDPNNLLKDLKIQSSDADISASSPPVGKENSHISSQGKVEDKPQPKGSSDSA